MTHTPSLPLAVRRLPAATLILFGLVNLPLSMLLSPTAAVLPNFYLEYTAVTVGGLAAVTLFISLNPQALLSYSQAAASAFGGSSP